MAGPTTEPDVTYIAQVSLANHRFGAVVAGATQGTVTTPAGAGVGRIIGILQNNPAINTAAVVRRHGISFGYCGRPDIVMGDELEISDTRGRLRRINNAGHGRIGASEEAGTYDDLITVNICPIDFSQIHSPSSSSSSSTSSSSTSSSSSSTSSSSG